MVVVNVERVIIAPGRLYRSKAEEKRGGAKEKEREGNSRGERRIKMT